MTVWKEQVAILLIVPTLPLTQTPSYSTTKVELTAKLQDKRENVIAYKRCASKVWLALAKSCHDDFSSHDSCLHLFSGLQKTQETKMLHLIQHQEIDSQMESKIFILTE